MFTGLIEEIGTIKDIRQIGGGVRIGVFAKKIMDDLKIDDSISINGACQTVVLKSGDHFEVEAVEETLRKTTLGGFRPGLKVNLERAMLPTTRMGGHLVQGHVECRGKVVSIVPENTGVLVEFSFPQEFDKYVVELGSICIDGISLTIARTTYSRFTVSIIPHTWKVTTFASLKPGDEVNLEFDILGKYIEKLISSGSVKKSSSGLDKFIDQPEW